MFLDLQDMKKEPRKMQLLVGKAAVIDIACSVRIRECLKMKRATEGEEESLIHNILKVRRKQTTVVKCIEG